MLKTRLILLVIKVLYIGLYILSLKLWLLYELIQSILVYMYKGGNNSYSIIILHSHIILYCLSAKFILFYIWLKANYSTLVYYDKFLLTCSCLHFSMNSTSLDIYSIKNFEGLVITILLPECSTVLQMELTI